MRCGRSKISRAWWGQAEAELPTPLVWARGGSLGLQAVTGWGFGGMDGPGSLDPAHLGTERQFLPQGCRDLPWAWG